MTSRDRKRVVIESEEIKNKKKKSTKGCYGKKRKRQSQRDVTDYSIKNEASAPRHTGGISGNEQYGVNQNERITSNIQDLNKFRNFDKNGNISFNNNPSGTEYSYSYHASGTNNNIGNSPIPTARTSNDINDNYKSNSLKESNEKLEDMNIHHNTPEHMYKTRTNYENLNKHEALVSNNFDKINHGNETKNDSERDVTEIIERKIITKGANVKNDKTNTNKIAESQSYVMGDSNEHFKRFRRTSFISNVSSSFSSGTSYRKYKGKILQISKQQNIKDEHSYSTSVGNNQSTKNKSLLIVEKSLGSLDKSKQVNINKKPIPVLKANKSYNISFAMHSKYLEQNLKPEIRKEQKTIQSVVTKKITGEKPKKSSKRIQTEIDYIDLGIQKQVSAFTPLMKDVDYKETKGLMVKGNTEVNRNNNAVSQTDNSTTNKSYAYEIRNKAADNDNYNNDALQSSYSYNYRSNNNRNGEKNNNVGNNSDALQTSYSYNYKSNNDGKGNNNFGNNNDGLQSSYSYNYRSNNNGMDSKNNAKKYAYEGNNYAWDSTDKGDLVYTNENMTHREWLEIEHPDGRREKRDYTRERNNEGDTNYIDLAHGNILKIDKADWKRGEELIKTKKGTHKIRYEWRKDPTANEWVKYNSDTNEILKRGDWKSGSEWYRNSKGKLVERRYTYIKHSDGRWIKSDSNSSTIIDYSNCSALKGYKWVPTKKSGYGKTKNGKWKKQEYEYVQNSKGKWIKQDPSTKRKLEKPSITGWKEGKAYNLDRNGKIKKVHYAWLTQNDGTMIKVNTKTKEPINTSWMQGREIIMQDNNVVTNYYTWVKNGKKKWIKIDENNGKPLTNNIRSNKVSTYNQSESKSKAYVNKISTRTDNNKIIEENTKIEQNGGNLIKNTTTTVKY